jgi:nucleoside-diphosphate-sugar epimerase
MDKRSERPRILITGGSGFMGTNAVEHWSKLGFDVLNLDVKPPQNVAYDKLWVRCDITDVSELRAVYEAFRPHYLLHLGARTDLDESMNLNGYAANIDGVRNLTEIVGPGLRRAIFASSRMVCRIGYQPQHEEDYAPINLYGESKIQGERIVRSSRMDCEWLIVRPTSIWGPWFDVPYKQFFLAIQRGHYINPASCNAVKSFGFVGNSVEQLQKLFEAPAGLINHRTLYLCDYPPLRVREWAELIRQAMNAPRIIALPLALTRGIALLGDLMEKIGRTKAPLTSFRLSNLVTDMLFDTSTIQKICGPVKYSLTDGVYITVNWLFNRPSRTERPASAA